MVKKRCLHKDAITIISKSAKFGLKWCPDCGAVRRVKRINKDEFGFTTKRWIYPRGLVDVKRQLSRDSGLI